MTTTGAIKRSPTWNDTKATLASFDRVGLIGCGFRAVYKADLCLDAIGAGAYVTDHVRCVGYRDPTHAPFAQTSPMVCLLA